MTPTPEIEFENYTIEEEIGQGDVTIVYRARRESDNTLVAIKAVAPRFTFDPLFVRRFKEMAHQTTKLEHPNIVRVFEVEQEGELLYVVREFIEAQTLAQVLEVEGTFAPQRMLVVARQIANALDYAHQKSIMHGDLSANRIYIGQNDHITVVDFGHTQAMAGTSLVKQGYAIGSPEILAPERVHGQGPSRQSDLYSLGILCYQMLNGEPPFTGEPAAVLHAQAYEQPRPLHMVNPGVSVPLSEAIGRILSKGLELRYNTGAEFTRALAVAVEGSAPVRISSASGAQFDAGERSAETLLRRPWLWALIVIPVIIILLVAGFLAVSVWVAIQPIADLESTQVATQPTPLPPSPSPTEEQAPVIVIEPTATSTSPPAVASSPTSTSTTAPSPVPPTPTVTPTPPPLPTPGPPTVAEGSPFTNLVTAHAITDDNQPEKVGISFAPGTLPVYLFFDYANIEPGTPWTHRWRWGDTELGAYEDVWPDNYYEQGTAWIYYSPTGGYQPGPYQITIEVRGQTVATATFVIEPGGL